MQIPRSIIRLPLPFQVMATCLLGLMLWEGSCRIIWQKFQYQIAEKQKSQHELHQQLIMMKDQITKLQSVQMQGSSWQTVFDSERNRFDDNKRQVGNYMTWMSVEAEKRHIRVNRLNWLLEEKAKSTFGAGIDLDMTGDYLDIHLFLKAIMAHYPWILLRHMTLEPSEPLSGSIHIVATGCFYRSDKAYTDEK